MRCLLATSALLFVLAACSPRGEPRASASSSAGSTPAAPAAAAPTALASVVPPTTAAEVSSTTPPAVRPAAPQSGAAGDSPETRRPYREDIAVLKMGEPPRRTFLEDKHTSKGIEDTERDSVARGRRLVRPREDIEISGTYASADELAQAILDAFASNDPAPLHELHVTRTEFEQLFWPEFPQSRPATNIQATDAWGFHYAGCCDGVTAGLTLYGGRPLHLQHVRYADGFAPYTNFSLYHGVVIEAVDDRGESVQVNVATVFAERKGRWKVYIFNA